MDAITLPTPPNAEVKAVIASVEPASPVCQTPVQRITRAVNVQTTIEEYFEDTPHTLFNRVCLGGLGVCDGGLSVTGVGRVNTTCTAVADRCGDRCTCEAADCCSTCAGTLKDAYDCRNEVTDI